MDLLVDYFLDQKRYDSPLRGRVGPMHLEVPGPLVRLTLFEFARLLRSFVPATIASFVPIETLPLIPKGSLCLAAYPAENSASKSVQRQIQCAS